MTCTSFQWKVVYIHSSASSHQYLALRLLDHERSLNKVAKAEEWLEIPHSTLYLSVSCVPHLWLSSVLLVDYLGYVHAQFCSSCPWVIWCFASCLLSSCSHWCRNPGWLVSVSLYQSSSRTATWSHGLGVSRFVLPPMSGMLRSSSCAYRHFYAVKLGAFSTLCPPTRWTHTPSWREHSWMIESWHRRGRTERPWWTRLKAAPWRKECGWTGKEPREVAGQGFPNLPADDRETELCIHLTAALPENISFQLKLLPKQTYDQTITKARELRLIFQRAVGPVSQVDVHSCRDVYSWHFALRLLSSVDIIVIVTLTAHLTSHIT